MSKISYDNILTLLKLSSSKISNHASNINVVRKNLGLPVTMKYQNGSGHPVGYSFLQTMTLTEESGGHNYPLGIPVMLLMFPRVNEYTFHTAHGMALYRRPSRGLCVGNWVNTINAWHFTNIPVATFLDTIKGAPEELDRGSMYNGNRDSDVAYFFETLCHIRKEAFVFGAA